MHPQELSICDLSELKCNTYYLCFVALSRVENTYKHTLVTTPPLALLMSNGSAGCCVALPNISA